MDEQLAAHVDFAEQNISDELHFCGCDWSASDVMMSFPAEIAVMQGYAERAPKLARFVEAVHARVATRARTRRAYFIW